MSHIVSRMIYVYCDYLPLKITSYAEVTAPNINIFIHYSYFCSLVILIMSFFSLFCQNRDQETYFQNLQ